MSCVRHAHVKNQMIQVHGYSPQQFVFGKGALMIYSANLFSIAGHRFSDRRIIGQKSSHESHSSQSIGKASR